ncbi:hypothetical protein AA0117_g13246 [Alternaria alternata]|uniref:GPI anchored protein n=1 Tax=Alternaria alternata TaxID=5599 RepID=A0A4Q4MRJ3_ALTAL|nr:hypothetical protein AA0117_g13246 [Alternaria alternata]
MQLKPVLFLVAVGLVGPRCAAVLLPEVDVSIQSSNDSLQFSIEIDIESPEAAANADGTALHTTLCAYNMSRTASGTNGHVAMHNPTAVSSGTQQRPANATQGIFSNSTGPPPATGSLRIPSQVTLESLSRGSRSMPAVGSMLACVIAVWGWVSLL